MQLPVRDGRHGAVVGLENDRDLVGVAVVQMAVQAVVRRVQQTVVEPFEERCVRFVEHLREGPVPAQMLAREPCPEAAPGSRDVVPPR
ncbi:hypothetical protein OKW34_003040 [Paraburkholderia youngii]